MYKREIFSAATIRRSEPAIALAAIIVTIALLSGIAPASLQQTVAMMFVDTVLVIGLYTFVGNSGVFSFGHVSFMAIGAYGTALLTIPILVRTTQLPDLPGFLASMELSTVPAVLIGAGLAALIGFLAAIPLMRLNGLPAGIATFSLLLVVYTVVKNWRAVTAGPSVLGGMPLDTDVRSAGLWALIALAIAFTFQSSRAGRRLRASREDEIAAKASGVRVIRERVIAFTISAFIVGIGGGIYGHLLGSFDPDAFYLQATFLLVVMLVFGGVNSLSGAVLGTIFVSFILEGLRRLEPGLSIGDLRIPPIPNLSELGLGVLLVLVLALRPGGLTNNEELRFQRRVRTKREPSLHGIPDQPTVAATRTTEILELKPLRRPTAEAKLVAKGLGVRFGGVLALDDVDFKLDRNEILGVIGPNGAGKTTLINVLTGFQTPKPGTTFLGDEETTGWRPNQLTTAGICRTFQDIRLFPGLSALENVTIAGLGVGHSSVEATHRAADLLRWLDVKGKSDALAATLTHAEGRLVAIARALACRPSFLLLDEPAAGMSSDETNYLAELLKDIHTRFECGLLIVEHNIEFVMRLCHRIQVLDYGKTLAEGTPKEIRAEPAVIEAYLGRDHGPGSARN